MPNLVPYSFTAIIDSDSSGANAVASQAVSVKNSYDGTLATIYEDAAGTTPIAQPGAQTDANGVLDFYVEAGRYTIESGSRTEEVVIDDGSRTILTEAELATSKHLIVGDVVTITDRANSLWDIGSYTANGYDILDATGSGLQAQLRVVNNRVDAKAYGFNADGTTDDASALSAFLQNTSIEEIVSNTDIAINSRVNVTLGTKKKLLGDATLIYTGAAIANNIFQVDCNGNDFEMEWGTNGQDNAYAGLRVNSTLAMTSALPKVRICKGEHKNYHKTASGGVDNYCGYIVGSFEQVIIEEITSGRVGRDSGTGVAGSSGTNGFAVINSTTLFAKKVIHRNNAYKDMFSNETGAADVDFDYFGCFAPNPTNFPNGDASFNEYPEQHVESYGNTYYNPIGRSEKHQCVPYIHDNTVYRDGGKTINGRSVEFNCQWGVGIIENITIHLSSVSGTSPITTNYAPVSFFQGTDYSEKKGQAVAKNITIHNQIAPALANTIDYIVDLSTSGTVPTKDHGGVIIDGVSMLGGDCNHVAFVNYDTADGFVHINNISANINFSVIGASDECNNTEFLVENVKNFSGSDVEFFTDYGGTSSRSLIGRLSGYNNFGVNGSNWGSGTIGLPQALLHGTGLAGSSSRGGALSVQSVQLADTATHIFDTRGRAAGNHLVFINSDFAGGAALINCVGASGAIAVIYQTGATFSFDTAGTGNPGTAGRLNVWVDANGDLNFDNRLGSSRIFTVGFLG